MISIQNKLKPIGEMLAEITQYSYHYWRSAPKGVKAYIVWAEDEEAESLNADNLKQKQGIHGTIDYFTKAEFDDFVICFAHTNDNCGPQSTDEIINIYKDIQKNENAW